MPFSLKKEASLKKSGPTSCRHWLSFAALACLILAGSGCGIFKGGTPKPAAWDLEIINHTRQAGVLDLVGFDKFKEEDAVLAASQETYWNTNNLVRAGWKHKLLTLRLAEGVIGPEGQDLEKAKQAYVLNRTDALWKGWLDKGASGILLVLRFPGPPTAETSKARCRQFPLHKKAWKASKGRLQFEITDVGISPVTQKTEHDIWKKFEGPGK